MAETEVVDKKIVWTTRPQVGSAPLVTTINTTTGLKVASGQATTATASDTIVSGLTTVLSVVASWDDAPVVGVCEGMNCSYRHGGSATMVR